MVKPATCQPIRQSPLHLVRALLDLVLLEGHGGAVTADRSDLFFVEGHGRAILGAGL